MDKSEPAPREVVRGLAERMIHQYIRGLLSADELVKRIEQAWPGSAPESGRAALESLARGLCSQELCEACRAATGDRRDLAFARLSEYLARVLRDTSGTTRCAAREVREEVLQLTLVEILQSLRHEPGKPAQPMAFLGWARVILQRQLTHYWRQQTRAELRSLETEDKPMLLVEQTDENVLDPLLLVVRSEQRAELYSAIARLRNSNYRFVLHYLYFGELDAPEVASLLRVPATAIHLWHHRALHALQKQIQAHTPWQGMWCG